MTVDRGEPAGRYWRRTMAPGRDPDDVAPLALEQFRSAPLEDAFTRGGLLVAVVALASGELDAAYAVLADLPVEGTSSLLFTGRCLDELLPLPAGLDGRRAADREVIAEWLREHHSRLHWSEENERFELADSQNPRTGG